MAQISKLVRQRLAKSASALEMQSHPDADLLTGFLEQSLGSEERHRVMQHLVFCGECRDVVTSALPQEVELQNVSQPVLVPARPTPGWRSLVLVRWGSVAAALIIAVGAITMYRGQDAGVRTAHVADGQLVAPTVPKPAPTGPTPSSQISAAEVKPADATAKETVVVAKPQPQAETASRSVSEANATSNGSESKMKAASAKKNEAAPPVIADRGLARSRTDSTNAAAGVAGGVVGGNTSNPV
jgi:hypothetical protein